MTGYGKAAGMHKSRQITVELKTLNSKQLDITMKIPSIYNEMEPEIRSVIAHQLERGKVYCSVFVDNVGDDSGTTVNQLLAKTYYTQLKELEKSLGLPESTDYLSVLLRMPDILKTPQSEPDPEENLLLKSTLEQAVGLVNLFRAAEGKSLYTDIEQRVHKIETLLERTEPFEKDRIVRLKERMLKELNEGLENGFDQNRFEQEMIYYLEKLDITEEQIRLSNHLKYFLQVMEESSSGNGRKLGFIAQEIGREVNTLGSKANDANIQKLVVEMKDELEKIKEQLLNIL